MSTLQKYTQEQCTESILVIHSKMAPPKSTLGVPTPLPDTGFSKDVDKWLDDKRAIDGAEGLWRIHDGLYDVTTFIKSHPGGQFWLEDTKGTDITEAFEVHHISTLPESILQTFYVRKAKTARASPFTFEDNGFYRTVKRNVREALKTVPKDDITLSNIYSDGLLFATFTFAVLATTFWSYTFGIISGTLLGLTSIASHNYMHQRDNFRMYYSDLCMQDSREARIVHIISHHMLTNTIADMQTYFLWPMVNYFPEKKSILVKYISMIYTRLFLWTSRNVYISILKTYTLLKKVRHAEKIILRDIIPFLLPLTMCLFRGQSLLWTIVMWEFVLTVGNFCYAFVGFTGTHFHPDVFIDGDTPRPEEERDWGLNQLDTVADRHEVTGNHFLVLVTFGDHAVHHLFPTLDHGVLQHLYPIVEETIKQFNVKMHMRTQLDMMTGYFRQIVRETPNPNPPGLKI